MVKSNPVGEGTMKNWVWVKGEYLNYPETKPTHIQDHRKRLLNQTSSTVGAFPCGDECPTKRSKKNHPENGRA